MEELLKPILELGVVGLLFVMWWHERKDRLSAEDKGNSVGKILELTAANNAALLDVVRDNTAALGALTGQLQRLGDRLQALEHREREYREAISDVHSVRDAST